MEKERSFVMVKPDGVERGLTEDIIKRFTDAGLDITARKEMSATEEIVTQHYPIDNYDYVLHLGHKDISGMSEEEIKITYDKHYKIIKALHQYIKSGPVLALIIEGAKGTVGKVREIVGKTNPIEADKGTIRGDYGEDSYDQADKESRSVRNIIHASGTVEEAEDEIKNWFPEL